MHRRTFVFRAAIGIMLFVLSLPCASGCRLPPPRFVSFSVEPAYASEGTWVVPEGVVRITAEARSASKVEFYWSGVNPQMPGRLAAVDGYGADGFTWQWEPPGPARYRIWAVAVNATGESVQSEDLIIVP